MNDCATFVNSITESDAYQNAFIDLVYEGNDGHKQVDSDGDPCYDADDDSDDKSYNSLF